MRLTDVKLTNFRGYSEETNISLDPLTILIGRNDAGKSSILDALDVFFNDAPIEKDDCCVRTGATEIRIACVFDDLPGQMVIDDQHPTTLQDEFLLRSDGKLEIAKTYSCSAAKGKVTGVFAIANHPSVDGTNDLLALKIGELRTRARDRGVNLDAANQAIKTQVRRAIWAHAGDLALTQQDISVNRESGKEVWDQLQTHLPTFALFKADRPSTDQDSEAQDPLRSAVKVAIKRREGELNSVVGEIKQELERVAARTVAKIREMSPGLANQLHPTVKNKNWDSLFTISLTGEDEIPINKRGSGTRRLVLLNFFRAQAEEDAARRAAGAIYAIEEPETSQHPNHQVMLLDAFEDLVEQGGCQVLLTTHNPTLARRVECRCLRLVTLVDGSPVIEYGTSQDTLQRITDTLGVLPDHDVKLFFGVEGKNDINFLRRVSSILAGVEQDIPDLSAAESNGSLVFIPLGGSNLESWVITLAGLARPEYYLTDRDNAPPASPKYEPWVQAWRQRGCTAWITSKRTLENYLHPTLISREFPGYRGTGADAFEDVPLLAAEAAHNSGPGAGAWTSLSPEKIKMKVSAAKKKLNTTCAAQMTPALLAEMDPTDEIRTWLRDIGRALRG